MYVANHGLCSVVVLEYPRQDILEQSNSVNATILAAASMWFSVYRFSIDLSSSSPRSFPVCCHPSKIVITGDANDVMMLGGRTNNNCVWLEWCMMILLGSSIEPVPVQSRKKSSGPSLTRGVQLRRALGEQLEDLDSRGPVVGRQTASSICQKPEGQPLDRTNADSFTSNLSTASRTSITAIYDVEVPFSIILVVG